MNNVVIENKSKLNLSDFSKGQLDIGNKVDLLSFIDSVGIEERVGVVNVTRLRITDSKREVIAQIFFERVEEDICRFVIVDI